MVNHLLGFDIGGTKCAVLLGREGADRPEIVGREEFATSDYPVPSDALNEMIRRATLLKNRHLPNGLVRAGGVSCGGPLDSSKGTILSPPNLPAWDRVPVSRILGNALNIPVALQNDANACALAEWRWGAAQGAQTAIFLTFGTGLGAGVIIGGRLHEGADDLAGEIGHWRIAEHGPEGYGKHGSWEGFCSGGGMTRLAREFARRAGERAEPVSWWRDQAAAATIDVKLLAEFARQGDALALEVFQTAGSRLGQGLALLIDLLNPEVISIGSIFVRCEDLLRGPMEAVLARETLPNSRRRCRIVPAGLGESLGDFAALATAST